MGNSAAKALDETELGVGTVQGDDGRSISKIFVTTTGGTTKIKNKGKAWVQRGSGDDETLLWTSRSPGLFPKHSIIEDSTGKAVATIITVKKGFSSCTNFVCRSVPSYDGQEPLTDEELEKIGIKTTDSEKIVLYKFSKIEANRKLTTAKCTYGIVTGAEEIQALYEGERLSALGFYAVFKEIGGTENIVIAKATTKGMSVNPCVEAASGVDMLAVVSMGYSLAGDDSSAGALAGAGVT